MELLISEINNYGEKVIPNTIVKATHMSMNVSLLFILKLVIKKKKIDWHYYLKNHYWLSLDLQSIITVTFEVPGNAEEESLNVYIQVNALLTY